MDLAALHAAAHHQDDLAVAVVDAADAVLLDPAAELGEGHERDVRSSFAPRSVANAASAPDSSVRWSTIQPPSTSPMSDVHVPVAVVDGGDLQADVGLDQPGDVAAARRPDRVSGYTAPFAGT